MRVIELVQTIKELNNCLPTGKDVNNFCQESNENELDPEMNCVLDLKAVLSIK
jgi:hypothetical protein